jgi:hypothetical protein
MCVILSRVKDWEAGVEFLVRERKCQSEKFQFVTGYQLVTRVALLC